MVGAPFYDGIGESPIIDAGAAFVYGRSGTVWTVQAYLESPSSLNGGNFGTSVAISGDTVVVGEVQSSVITFGGRAYVFKPSGGFWALQAVLAASNPGAGDSFGSSVAIDQDTAVVGAPGEDGNGTSQTDNSATDSGAAYVYHRSGTVSSQQAYLKASPSFGGLQFGTSVSISGDLIAVGAPETILPSVTVFTRSGSVWTQLTSFASSNLDIGDRFGSAVAISGGTVVVGAPEEGSDGTSPTNDSHHKRARRMCSQCPYRSSTSPSIRHRRVSSSAPAVPAAHPGLTRRRKPCNGYRAPPVPSGWRLPNRTGCGSTTGTTTPPARRTTSRLRLVRPPTLPVLAAG